MGWEWGPLVKFCSAFDSRGDTCRFCLACARFWHVVLFGHSSTFVGNHKWKKR